MLSSDCQRSWWGQPVTVAALAVALAALAQSATVRFNYAGNLTGLFYHGALCPSGPQFPGERLFLHADTVGYDGQHYHTLAHDPFLRHGYAQYLDRPRMRARRILIPALAYLLSGFGTPGLVDTAYLGLVLACVGLGTGMLAAWARQHARSPAWGLVFLLIPATLTSLDRLTIDIALAALCVSAVALADRRRDSWLFAVAMLAPLSRETGLLLWAAIVGSRALVRDWRRAAWFSLAVIPTIAWFAYVAARTVPDVYPSDFSPLSGFWRAWLDPLSEQARVIKPTAGLLPLHAAWRILAPTVAAFSARLALLGCLTAMILAFVGLCRSRGWAAIAAASFACLALFLQQPDIWIEAYGFGRILSPLFVFVVMEAIGRRGLWGLVALGMVVPALLQPISGQLKGIVLGMLGP